MTDFLPLASRSVSLCPHHGLRDEENKMTEAAGMEENLAGTLCYAGWWITGLIFFLIDKRPKVRFHAAQSMVVFGGLSVFYWIAARIFFSAFGFAGYGLFSIVS